MSRYLKLMFTLILFYLLAVLILHPAPAMNAVNHALHLCVRVVIPSLFPFFVCSRLLIDFGVANLCSRILSPWMHPLFGVPGSGALAVVLGVLSGYPIGAATVVNLYESGSCTKSEGERLLAFCNNAGPLFILGAVGVGMLHNQTLGILLYLVHLISALLTGFLFRNSGKSINPSAVLPPGTGSKPNLASAFSNAVSDGVNNILKVCGFVVFFSVVCSAFPREIPLLHALLEVTGGIQSIIDQATTFPFLLPTISALLALSGFSILSQTAGIVLPSGLSFRPCLIGKLVQALLSFLLTFFLCEFFPISQPAFSQAVPPLPLPTPGQLFTLAMVDFLVAVGTVGLFSLLAVLSQKTARKK